MRRTEVLDITKHGVKREMAYHANADTPECRVTRNPSKSPQDVFTICLTEWFYHKTDGETGATRDELTVYLCREQAEAIRDGLDRVLSARLDYAGAEGIEGAPLVEEKPSRLRATDKPDKLYGPLYWADYFNRYIGRPLTEADMNELADMMVELHEWRSKEETAR